MIEKPLLIVMVGLPRSGKSTWARKTGLPTVCPDQIRFALHGQRFQALAEPFVWAIAKVMVRALFGSGHTHVILDATNTTAKRRQEWDYPDAPWRVEYKIINTLPETCESRARAGGDLEIIPIIEKQFVQFEALPSDAPLYDDL